MVLLLVKECIINSVVMKMQSSETLYFLFWSLDCLLNPTFRNLTDSFEGWAHRRGILRQIHRLEHRNLLERDPAAAETLVYRLTECGRLQALGGRDPQKQWNRHWDGQWRLIAFDLPEKKSSTRVRLRRYLRARHYGFLQNSVWVSPDPLPGAIAEGKLFGDNVECLVCFEARPSLGAAHSAIVNGAWNFQQINKHYRECLQILKACPLSQTMPREETQSVHQWFRREQAAWEMAVSMDPLLPEALLPEGYLGKTVWQARVKVLPQVSKRLRCTVPNDVPTGT